MINFKTLIAIMIIGLVTACSMGSGGKAPSIEEVDTEFRYVFSVASASNPSELKSVEVLRIDRESGAPAAEALIKYMYVVNGVDTEKESKFLLRRAESGWQIYDRDLANPNSSTSFEFRE